jgi:hypothetical protein
MGLAINRSEVSHGDPWGLLLLVALQNIDQTIDAPRG